ncbi:MAG TPA: ferrochelatase [Thermoanaerobaculia bacterium]|nr:ferrochelatase [Thermoanaerobaculia bacterium]
MTDKLGVLLVQLGGPERREELKPFLYELFVDPEILSIRFTPLRKLVAWMIATLRAPQSAKIYERIGWSPIRRWSEAQARLLEEALAAQTDGGTPAPAVRVGMTCSEPTVETALDALRAGGATRLLVLPLYPQYSVTTTRGSFARVSRALAAKGWAPERRNAPDAWYDEPGFIAAHVERILAAAARLPDPDPGRTVVLYSAHSLPVKTVTKEKDPYPRQIEETVRLIDAALGNRYRSRLGYQSRVGPVEWLGPSTPEVLKELATAGEKQVLVVPVAFVSDHVETLYEIRLLFGEEAARLGIPHYAVAEGLNDHPAFIRSLADIVRKAAA